LEINDLYQDLIIDHGRRPRNFGPLAEATSSHQAHNPLCGDQVCLHLQMEGERIVRVRFEGEGCALSMASASLLTEIAVGKTREELLGIAQAFHHQMVSGEPGLSIGPLEALLPVREYPMRVKCVTMVWHALREALRESHA